nr:230_t:CDS:2 [Entrophospora candida]
MVLLFNNPALSLPHRNHRARDRNDRNDNFTTTNYSIFPSPHQTNPNDGIPE